MFLILDDLKVHHGKLAAAWLEKNKEKLEVFFLPPYAPEYNPDEYLRERPKFCVTAKAVRIELKYRQGGGAKTAPFTAILTTLPPYDKVQPDQSGIRSAK